MPFPRATQVTEVRFTPSGRSVVLVVNDSTTSDDLYLVSLATPDAEPVPLARSRFREHQPRVSPDGRWLAYTSDETGRDEIYSDLWTGWGWGPRKGVERWSEPDAVGVRRTSTRL
jgi:Tol biopolymer transport system component